MADESERLDHVELELAHTKDDLRRTRLELAKAKAHARDALNCLRNEWDHGDPNVDGAIYNLGLILDLDRPQKKDANADLP